MCLNSSRGPALWHIRLSTCLQCQYTKWACQFKFQLKIQLPANAPSRLMKDSPKDLFPAPMWKVQMDFQTPGIQLDQIWLMSHWGVNQWIDLSLSFPHLPSCLFLSFLPFQINEVILKTNFENVERHMVDSETWHTLLINTTPWILHGCPSSLWRCPGNLKWRVI